jgi:hypothetical protein
MGLELDVLFQRENFFPGETLQCKIQFKNKISKEEKYRDPSSSPVIKEALNVSFENLNINTSNETKNSKIENIEACSVFILGLYITEPNWVKPLPKTKNESNYPTYLDTQKKIGMNLEPNFHYQASKRSP